MRFVQDYIVDAARRFPEKTAIICDEEKISYEELKQEIFGLATVLVEAGVRKGDRVLILLHGKKDLLIACYATIAAGAIAVPVLAGAALYTIEQNAKDSTPLILITSTRDLIGYPTLRDRLKCEFLLLESSPPVHFNRSVGNVMRFELGKKHPVNGRLNSQYLKEDDGALILYTTGTSGKKKGVLLSHRNLVQAALNINEFMRIDSSIREFVMVPLDHSFGFGRSRCVFFVGGTLVANNGMLNPVSVVHSVTKHQCNAISSVPAGFAMFFGRLESLLKRIGPQIRFIELGSASMPLDHKMKMLEIFPNARICMHYGLTEASRSTFIEFRGEQRKLDAVGRPSPNVDISIRDAQGRRVDRLEMGEIVVRGAHVTVGYWRNDELSSRQFTEDKWFKTGDYGFLDEVGYLHFIGRKDEIINMSGVKISPIEVEQFIHKSFPNCEVCVVGVPDPANICGEIPVLCYVSKEGRTITPSGLMHALSNHLDQIEIPRIIFRIESLPKTENLKVSRRELRKKLLEGTAHQIERVGESSVAGLIGPSKQEDAL